LLNDRCERVLLDIAFGETKAYLFLPGALLEGLLVLNQSNVSTAKRLAFALPSCVQVQIFGGAICGEQLLSPQLAP
jgi:hypothetical protein